MVPLPSGSYLPFLGDFALSDTVVRGCRFAVEAFTYRPVMADLCFLPIFTSFLN